MVLRAFLPPSAPRRPWHSAPTAASRSVMASPSKRVHGATPKFDPADPPDRLRLAPADLHRRPQTSALLAPHQSSPVVPMRRLVPPCSDCPKWATSRKRQGSSHRRARRPRLRLQALQVWTSQVRLRWVSMHPALRRDFTAKSSSRPVMVGFNSTSPERPLRED